MNHGSRAFCILMALTAAGAESAPASAPSLVPSHYCVEAKMVSVSPAVAGKMMDGVSLGYFSEETVVKLTQSSGAKTLSFPWVEAAELNSTHIDVTRVAALPHGLTHQVGINLDVVPQKVGTDFGFQISVKDVRFQGFQDRSATIPIFHTGRVTTSIPVSAQPPSGYYCINVPAPQKLAKTYDADGRVSASVADANERQLLFVKITRG